jgi:hypothetical protein
MSNSFCKTTTVAILTVMLLTFVTASASYPYTNNNPYSNINYTKGLYGYGQEQQQVSSPLSYTPPANQTQQQDVQVQVMKGKPDNPGKPDKGDKTKPDKGDKGGKDKKPKKVQNVKISGEVDVSQVTNATDAAQAYSFVVTSGSFTSKAKSLEDSGITDATETLTLHFNGKLAVNAGDAFTITGVSKTDAYNTVSGTGTFVEQPQGKSGKTVVSGTLDEVLVLQETAVEDLT